MIMKKTMIMNNVVLWDDDTTRLNLKPITSTRYISDILVGLSSISEKWTKEFGYSLEQGNLDWNPELASNSFLINASIIPSKDIIKVIQENLGKSNVSLGKTWLLKSNEIDDWKEISLDFIQIAHLWDIFLKNHEIFLLDAINANDFRKVSSIEGVTILGDELYVRGNPTILPCILNTTTGSIFIDDHAQIMEGCQIRGPFYLGCEAQVKMGTKIYGATSIGKSCKVAGELSNVIIHPFTNKAHDGFLGNSVLGSWCNLGAGTISSNLKNNYSLIDLYHYSSNSFEPSGQQFIGLIMGDYSKSSIGTTFNTATVVGVCALIATSGFPPKFIPDFTWLVGNSSEIYDFSKALATIEIVCKRRNLSLTEFQKNLLHSLYPKT